MVDDAKLINMFDEPSSHRSSSFPPSSNSSYGDLLDGLGDSDDPLLNMSHSGTDEHDFFGGATTTTNTVPTTTFPSSSAHEELLTMSAPSVSTTSTASTQHQQHHHHHAHIRQQQGYHSSNTSKVQQMNGSFVSMNIGGSGLQQQQQQQQQGMNQRNGTMMNISQQPNKPSSAPSSGNRLKSNTTPNVFDSFQDKQSPFADLGRLI